MPLAYEHIGSKKPTKINTYTLTRAELLITLCYETPCKTIETLALALLPLNISAVGSVGWLLGRKYKSRTLQFGDFDHNLYQLNSYKWGTFMHIIEVEC
jgi:hypothetical protein